MKHRLLVLIMGVISLGLGASAPGAEQSPRPLILVHVMPWFEAKSVSKGWGWHWRMNHFDPDQVGTDNRRSIASHLYPRTGPYDSLDPTILEYQTLLMKVAGVDGVIIDWYGLDAVDDYASIHQRTLALIAALKQRGLKFAICYEDRVIARVATRDKLTTDQATQRGTEHLRFAAEHWFADPLYVQWEGKPLLMVFGPDFLTPAQWTAIIPSNTPSPAFFTLHERKGPAVGSFAWPPMWASKDGVLAPKDLDAYLDRFARQTGGKIPCAFPGFHDIYKEANNRPSYGFLNARDGATFRQTLDRALQAGSPILQVATWNDYGEGTEVEPTREFGNRYLAMIQDARRNLEGPAFPYATADLDLPYRIYLGRELKSIRVADRPHIDAAVRLLDAEHPEQARAEIDQAKINSLPEPVGAASSFRSTRKRP